MLDRVVQVHFRGCEYADVVALAHQQLLAHRGVAFHAGSWRLQTCASECVVVLAGTPPVALAALHYALRKAEATKVVREFHCQHRQRSHESQG